MNANVSLKLKDFSKVAPIVQQLADTDVTENQSLNYTLEDMDAAKTKAVEDAYRRARESAAALAAAPGARWENCLMPRWIRLRMCVPCPWSGP